MYYVNFIYLSKTLLIKMERKRKKKSSTRRRRLGWGRMKFDMQ